MNILIDSGANKNIVAPDILENIHTVSSTTIKNVKGTSNVTEKGTIDLFNGAFKPLSFYVLKFHYFFDGLIGSETLAKLKAHIDYENGTLTLSNKQFFFSKFYPTKQIYNHLVTIETCNDGDWLAPTFQKLGKGIVIQPYIKYIYISIKKFKVYN